MQKMRVTQEVTYYLITLEKFLGTTKRGIGPTYSAKALR
jgi:adenylosuccinate synthase